MPEAAPGVLWDFGGPVGLLGVLWDFGGAVGFLGVQPLGSVRRTRGCRLSGVLGFTPLW